MILDRFVTAQRMQLDIPTESSAYHTLELNPTSKFELDEWSPFWETKKHHEPSHFAMYDETI